MGCSSSDNTVSQRKTENNKYIFDEVPPENYYKFETPPEVKNALYVVQIGAFSTLERAKQFADISRKKLQKDIKVNYNVRNNLYVVQIHPPFKTKTDAERYRNELWRTEDYSDAWVLLIEEDKN